MTFRTRILLACLAVAAVPLLILAAGARHVVRERLTEGYAERVSDEADALRRQLESRARTIDARLQSLADGVADDPALRAALATDAGGSTVVDFAPYAMRAAGLDFLLLVDSVGTVLSSGHFRSDFGRAVPAGELPHARTDPGAVALTAQRPGGEFIALVRAHRYRVGGREYRLIGGFDLDSVVAAGSPNGGSDVKIERLAPDARNGGVSNQEGPAGSDDAPSFAQRVVLPYLDASGTGTIQWLVALPPDRVGDTIRLMDRWFIIALGAALLLSFLTARIAAATVTRPLEQLARNASRVELTRYDVRLASPRRDEVGSLSRLLDRMVQRLRTAAQQLRESERRATVGDMARQVNHDIRNGLLPIRNVIQHLGEVAEDSPSELATVFSERAGTLKGGIGYLENLATNYARLTPRIERQQCDVNAVLEALRDASAPGDDRIRLELAGPLPRATADPIALRRVVENLMVNALESLPDGRGRVTIRTTEAAEAGDRRVIITVADTGSGIAPESLDRIFDDFHTTKERGTGLGLSIVRRLVTDMGGRVRVQSEPGQGTTFTVELPVET